MMYHEDKRLKVTKNTLIKDNTISKKNKNTILKFLDELSAQGISIGRVQKYCYYLTRISKIINKDFTKVNKNDIINLLNQLENAKVRSGARKGKPLSDWSKHDYRLVIKKFYKWLRIDEGRNYGLREYPPEVAWFTISFPREKIRKPRNLLDIKDVEKIVNAASNTRNKLFVRLIYETGARIGELLTLSLDGINFDEHGATVQIYGKTGERKVRIKDSVPLLSAWLREHPNRENKQSLLFCGLNGKKLGYDYWRILLHRLGKKIGIKKPMNPHHFRHSRATELSKYLTESQLCYYMGWVPGSSQTGTYVHLSGRDLDGAILRMHGIKIDEEKVEKKEPIKCPRCHVVNDSFSKFCNDCGLSLDEKSMIEYDQQKENAAKIGQDVDSLLEDPVILKQLIMKLSDRLEEKTKEK